MDCEFLLYVLMFAFEQRRSLSNTPGSSVRMKFVNSQVKDLQKQCRDANGSYIRIV